ncbi:MAG TPA: hypothetical protein VHK91_04060 [Flavisolibacter sp.]|jgi:hypothetical protein|nr:hypothetical protein [Flavisolibacter sp.]
MPESRKRPGHHEHQKPSNIPSSQRTKGRITWAILIGLFGLILTYFSASDNYLLLIAGTLIGGIIGYIIGMRMEKDVSHK